MEIGGGAAARPRRREELECISPSHLARSAGAPRWEPERPPRSVPGTTAAALQSVYANAAAGRMEESTGLPAQFDDVRSTLR